MSRRAPGSPPGPAPRPPPGPPTPRARWLRVPVTEEEHAFLRQVAADVGLPVEELALRVLRAGIDATERASRTPSA